MSPSTTGPASPASSLMTEREWTKLLSQIADGRVVPVIGPELLCVSKDGEPEVRLYDVWGQALAEQRGLGSDHRWDETPLLYRIANQLSVSPDMPLGDLECDVHDIVSDARWPIPESLRQLAAIQDFPLYITTNIDRLLEAALGQERASHTTSNDVLALNFRRGGNLAGNDLPQDFAPGQQRTVFHLFGATSMDPEGFAATEDTLIEFSWALIDQDYAPTRLYDFLRKKTLLLLGCDFPDWLARFLIHALIRKADAQTGVVFVSGSHREGLRDFLRRKRASLPPAQSPASFVAELHRRWQLRQSPVSALKTNRVPEGKHGAVFISYARDNLAAALAIRAQLDEAKIDTWMDDTGLDPGAEFEQVIRDNIGRASFFVALISDALNLVDSNRPGRFVLREWKWAEHASEERSKESGFLQPVVIDDTPAGSRFIDLPFRNLHWTSLRDGRLPPSFIDFIRTGIRRFRSQPSRGTR